MADWNVVGLVVGTMLDGFRGPGPAGFFAAEEFGAAGGRQVAALTAPSPGSAGPFPLAGGQQPPAPAVPPTPLVPPGAPPVEPPGSGLTDEAAQQDSADIAQIIEELAALDAEADALVEAMEAAGVQGQLALDAIAVEIDEKITELGPRLNTPMGQQELRDFLVEKLTAAKQLMEEQQQISLDNAQELARITQRLTEIAPSIDPAVQSSEASTTAPTSPTVQDSAATTDSAPSAATDQAAATPTAHSPFTMPSSMPGLSSGAMPSMGTGMPTGTFSDPLSALSGMSGLAAPEEQSLTDDSVPAEPEPEPESESATEQTLSDDSPVEDETGDLPDSDLPDEQATETAAAEPDDEAHLPDDDTDDADDEAQPASVEVQLPDGTTVSAPSPEAATALRSCLDGASVADGYADAGITLPPPGTPVLSPVSPADLLPGDVGVWSDHMVLALGDGQVWVTGQVQPISSVESGPDFLGWMRPAPGTEDSAAAEATSTPN